jgi:hypothetical protein
VNHDLDDDLRPPGTVTVRCSAPRCTWWFWVGALDPRLPDGPFFCDEHRDDAGGAKEVALPDNLPARFRVTTICDCCGVRRTVNVGHPEGICEAAAAEAYAWDGCVADGWRQGRSADGNVLHLCPKEAAA